MKILESLGKSLDVYEDVLEQQERYRKSIGVRKVDEPYYEKLIVEPIKRFPRANCGFDRVGWDREFQGRMATQDKDWFDAVSKSVYSFPSLARLSLASPPPITGPGDFADDDLIAAAIGDASWKVHTDMGGFVLMSDFWTGPVNPVKVSIEPDRMSRLIKKVAMFFGADIVGICRLQERFVYAERDIPHKFAIVVGVEMSYDLHKTAPSFLYDATAGDGYSKLMWITTRLAQFIRGIGYPAESHGTHGLLNIPLAIDAGLGEQGRLNLLITPEFGPRARICAVTTDLPLIVDKPIDMGVQQFCKECQKCAVHCPSRAIADGERSTEPYNISNNPGYLRWVLDAEKCLIFWLHNRKKWAGCGVCIAVCPWNKKNNWFHNLVKRIAIKLRSADPLLVRLDDAFGYGKRIPPEKWLWS